MPHDCRDVLVELSFESILCDIEADALLRLARQVWRSNVSAGITGEMCLQGARVRQVLEGAMEVVLPIAARILADPRHTAIELIAFGELAARRHAEWRVHGLPVECQVRSDNAMASLGSSGVAVVGRKRAACRTA